MARPYWHCPMGVIAIWGALSAELSGWKEVWVRRTDRRMVAEQIAHTHNLCPESRVGGFLVFEEDGSGGSWFAQGSPGPGQGRQLTLEVLPRARSVDEVLGYLEQLDR